MTASPHANIGGASCSSTLVGTGLACASGADCQSNVCSAGVCVAMSGSGGSPLTANFTFSTDWGAGYCVTLNVTNPTATAFNNWSALVDTKQDTAYLAVEQTGSLESGSARFSRRSVAGFGSEP